MLALAREAVDAAGLGERIELRRGCRTGASRQRPTTSFSPTASSTILRILPSCGSPARSGGHVFAMDLMRPESEGRLRELAASYRGEPEVLQRDFRNSLRPRTGWMKCGGNLRRAA